MSKCIENSAKSGLSNKPNEAEVSTSIKEEQEEPNRVDLLPRQFVRSQFGTLLLPTDEKNSTNTEEGVKE